jgi:GTP-binding protein HflX
MVAQRNIDHFTVGIVGYTNAGKSTLFNTLTAGGAYADDRLFATLVTRTREWDLGGGTRVMLSDTVGFVRDLPHNLVASFKATLEEATHAHLLLIVLDVSDPSAERQYATVNSTLDELFTDLRERHEREARRAGNVPDESQTFKEPRRVLLLNKIDRLEDNASLLVWQQRAKESIAICARDAKDPGLATLRTLVEEASQGVERELNIRVSLSDAKTVDTLEKRARVLDRSYTGSEVRLKVVIGQRLIDQLRSRGAKMVIEGEKPVLPSSARPEGWTARKST